MSRRGTAVLTAGLFLASASHAGAQMRTAPPAPAPEHGYVVFVAQSAFGNVTSQSYGVEAGGNVGHGLQVFAEVGNVRDVATAGISAAAQLIAGALSQLQTSAVSYSVRQPVTFFSGGVRYIIPTQQTTVRPYVLGGYGVARVKNDVVFQLGGTDATSTLSQFVTIGSDLSGEVTKPLLTLGGGVVWPAWKSLIVDVGYRYGRIFMGGGDTGTGSTSTSSTTSSGITVNRAGIGLGVRF